MNVDILIKEIRVKAMVESASHPGSYYVVCYDDDRWVCTCPDFVKRGPRQCKHIAVTREATNL